MSSATTKSICKGCQKPFVGNRTYCTSECRDKTIGRPSRPSCRVLRDAIKEYRYRGEPNWSFIGKMFGADRKTVRIWAEQYGLVPVEFYLGKTFY